jgi:hypothetical protein
MKVRALMEIPTARGIIPAGQIIEIPESLMVKLKGKVAEITTVVDDKPFMKDSHTSLTPAVIVDPVAPAKAIWPPAVQSNIDWFTTLDHPTEPFYLEDHRHIVDPEKFFSALRMDIKAGPDGARGKYGALIHDLNTLKKILH